MKLVNRFIVPSAVLIAASLLLARVHPFGDASLYPKQHNAAALLQNAAVTPQVRGILQEKCADCHSTQTRTPFYGRFAPISWLLERDIVEARKAMNLSQWNSSSDEQQQTLQAKIVQQVKSRNMPVLQYRLIHWNARITDADEQAIVQWARGNDAASHQSTSGPVTAGDPVRGKDVFNKRCTGCHALEADREGPRLQGVFGRAAGSVPGYSYSPALKKAHIVWNADTLDRWLADPDSIVPGNNMEFHVAKAEERRDLVRFLQQGNQTIAPSR
jgi:cytochrome c